MRVLFLGPETSGIYKYLSMVETDLLSFQGSLTETYGADIVVSHGYRHMVPPDILQGIPLGAYNCHISLLPLHRGADPNLWSWIEDTKKGVTIHSMTETLDDGPVYRQRIVPLDDRGTLRTTYDELQREMLSMFASWWDNPSHAIVRPEWPSSFHSIKDRKHVQHLLTEGWDTPVKKLVGALKAA